MGCEPVAVGFRTRCWSRHRIRSPVRQMSTTSKGRAHVFRNCMIIPLCIVLVASMRQPAESQTSEGDDVVQLSSDELGPFRPEKRPALEDVEQLIVEKTNAFREENSLSDLTVDETLQKTAEDFASYMARTDRYGHRADGRSAAERARAHDYELCLIAENIAYFFATEGFATKELANQAVEGWIDSPPHRRNMLKAAVTQIGVGVAQSEATGTFYAVQLFGRPKSQSITFKLTNKSDQSIDYSLGRRTYTLPPSYIRTHEMCTPSTLQLKSAEQDKPRTPEDGDAFVLTSQNGEIVLEKGSSE